MTLQEKFTNAIVLPFEYDKKIQESLIIADEFAVGFAEWFHENCYEDQLGLYTAEELLETYKKEKGL